MLPYHNINPVAFSFGSMINVHWYGIMYMLSFLVAWLLLRTLARRQDSKFTPDDVEDLITWFILGVILGGRLGYILFYDLPTYLASPLSIFKIWNGGMSFHGGFIGVLTVIFFWCKKHKKNFLDLTDFIAPVAPIGLFFGRIGNFINGELWGVQTNLPWGIIFPYSGDLPRHPTQLYEGLLEGLLLFLILWTIAQKPRKNGFISGIFCIGYAVFRSFSEIFRVPDPQYGYFLEYFTMGQILSLPMLFLGIYLVIRANKLPTINNTISNTTKNRSTNRSTIRKKHK